MGSEPMDPGNQVDALRAMQSGNQAPLDHGVFTIVDDPQVEQIVHEMPVFAGADDDVANCRLVFHQQANRADACERPACAQQNAEIVPARSGRTIV